MPEPMSPILYILLAVVIGWVITLSSGVVIGYIVFRVKRDPSDPMFQFHKPKAEVFNIAEDWEKEALEPEPTPKEVAEAAERFRQQQVRKPKIAETLGEKEEDNA